MITLEKFVIEENRFLQIDENEKLNIDKNSKNKIKWGVDEPSDDDASDDIDLDSPDNTESLQDLIAKFDTEKPFFIQGKAGWGKTTVIKKLAKKYGKEIITVYLDKAEAVDLGGIPVPVEGTTKQNPKYDSVANADDVNLNDKKDVIKYAKQLKAMPQWATEMLENPDKEYLLFFDEMNQAAPDVMNALMPIVLDTTICEIKFDNFFVGAAGNFESENGAVNELSGPLKSRFKPIIIWDSGSKAAWKQVFKYLHKKWDKVIGENLVSKFEEYADCFENPREIEDKIFDVIHRLKVRGVKRNYDARFFLRQLNGLQKEDITRTQEKQLEELSDMMFSFIKNEDTDESKSRKRERDSQMIPESIKSMIKSSMELGYFTLELENEKNKVERVKFGVSKETIGDCIDENEVNAEMLERTIHKFENDGLTWKYDKPQDWKKLGLEDPLDEKWGFKINTKSKIIPVSKKKD